MSSQIREVVKGYKGEIGGRRGRDRNHVNKVLIYKILKIYK